MQLYMVVSYYSDEQQAAWDIVPADSVVAAKTRVDAARPDSVVCQVLTLNELKEVVAEVEATTIKGAEAAMRELEGRRDSSALVAAASKLLEASEAILEFADSGRAIHLDTLVLEDVRRAVAKAKGLE